MVIYKILIQKDKENISCDQQSESVDEQEGVKKNKRLKKYKEVLDDRIEGKRVRREERARRERLGLDKMGKKRQQINNEFFDTKAELGSDNEDHDHLIKDDKDSEQSQDENYDEMNKDFEDIIDYGEVEDGDEEGALAKYMKDLDDAEQKRLKQVISGDYVKRAKFEEELMNATEEDKKQRLERMQAVLKSLENRDGGDSDDDINDKILGINEKNNKEINYSKLLGIEKEEESNAVGYDQIARDIKKTIGSGVKKEASNFFKEGQFKNVMDRVNVIKGNNKNLINNPSLVNKQQDPKLENTFEIPKNSSFNNAKNSNNLLKNNTENNKKLANTLGQNKGYSRINSILSRKNDGKSISLFNSQANEDIVNEFGNSLANINASQSNKMNTGQDKAEPTKDIPKSNDLINNDFFNKKLKEEQKSVKAKNANHDKIFMFRKKQS